MTSVPSPFRLVHSEVKPLTKELATQFRDMEPSPTERELNANRVKHLREMAEAGLLVTFHWATVSLAGKKMRVNGQGSSNMLCGLNGEFPAGLRVHVDDYEADDMDGVVLLYRQFDPRQSSRTPSDIARAYQMPHEPLRGVPTRLAKLGIEGIVWWRGKVQELAGVPKGDERYRLFNRSELHSFLRWLGEIFGPKTEELRSTPVVAAMYATFDKNETSARTFWGSVARGGDEFNDNAPATRLCDFLKHVKDNEAIRGQGPLYQGSAYCWNAYRDGKSIAAVKYDVSKGWYEIAE